VLWTSDFLRQNAIPLAGLVLVAAVAAVWFVRTLRGRFVLHALLLRLPRVGKLLAKIATSRFASTAAVLHGAGCNVLVTLDTAADTCGNAVLERGFRGASDAVRRGSTVGEALEGRDEVDPLLKQLVSVGERSGKLDECLKRLVAHYDEEIPRAVKSTLAIVEPALLVGAGLVVGFIVFAAITPIFKMYENI
jgi:type IV pilus assembly protein PilC